MFYKRNPKQFLLVVVILILVSLAVTASAPASLFPDIIPLPDGFQPEGIAAGRGTTFYAGSIPTGAVYRGNLATGEGDILVPGQKGHQSIGMKYDSRSNQLFVAGGPTGAAFVYDADTGADVARIQLAAAPPTFINDVVVTQDAAYFTDSSQPVLYRVPLDKNGGLPDSPVSEVISLSGDYVFVPGAFNANGIDATSNGQSLVIVSSVLGNLYQVDPTTGFAALIDLGGGSVPNGDGILLHGQELYVVQNFSNQIAVIQLDSGLNSGSIVDVITSPDFRVPTTIARFGSSLYAVNARFDTPPTPDTEYDVARLERH